MLAPTATRHIMLYVTCIVFEYTWPILCTKHCLMVVALTLSHTHKQAPMLGHLYRSSRVTVNFKTDDCTHVLIDCIILCDFLIVKIQTHVHLKFSIL